MAVTGEDIGRRIRSLWINPADYVADGEKGKQEASMFSSEATWTSAEAAEKTFKIEDYQPDRRRHARNRVRFTAEARRLDNTLSAQRTPKFGLTVLDLSEGGISAFSRQPVQDGERLLIHMPPSAGTAKRVFGRVIRCTARRDGWFLAMRFDYVPAA
jgi:hypothetical protein